MSFFGSWPDYKISKFRGAGELLFKALRSSWKVDRIMVPLLVPTVIFVAVLKNSSPKLHKETPNPYTEAILKKKAEGAYDGNNIGIR